MKKTLNISRQGLTLVELLVVISIMGLLTALIVPQVRLINKDRNIREAARVVGTALTQARDRAVASGAAGLMIERNQNLVQKVVPEDRPAEFYYYGGTRLYLMRNVPNYTDNYGGGCAIKADTANTKQVYIRDPFRTGVIQAGDEIAFNGNPSRYQIVDVQPGVSNPDLSSWGLTQTRLTIYLGVRHAGGNPLLYSYQRPLRETDVPPPNGQPGPDGSPPSPEEVEYTIFRQPRKMESSRIDLPEGYIIDLRYSGPIAPTFSNGGGNVADETPTTKFSYAGDTTPVYLVFDKDGGVRQMGLNGNLGIPVAESIDLFVTEYRPEDVLAPNAIDDGVAVDETAYQVLSNPAALWVTLGSQTGSVNVGYNAPPINPNGAGAMILGARQTARTRTSANQ